MVVRVGGEHIVGVGHIETMTLARVEDHVVDAGGYVSTR
jgi:hypothetical protein